MIYRKYVKPVLATGIICILFGCTNEKDKKEITVDNEPLNVILMIGDGMGVPQISTAYYFGDREANFSQFDNIGFHQTADKSSLITDSAAGATAFATGKKTYKRAIGVDQDTVPQQTILEYLKGQDYLTGLISLTTITHATPAAFYAHVKDRDMHDEIAEQLTNAGVDFIAGGGRKYFKDRKDSINLFDRFKGSGYNLDTTALTNPDYDKRNAFIISDEGLPSKIEGRKDFLKDATLKALDYFEKNNKPFFMMVEGSYIDWGGHAENEEMLVSELEDFDETLGAVIDYVRSHPNTLLVVTADHETGGVSIGKYYDTDDTSGKKTEVNDRVKVYFNSDQHSGELIPVFAMGTGSERFRGIYQNNEIQHKMMDALKNE
ncbi:alkaline phosphatase [Robertkochia solimangrovi]|uniref:alkaline phosphatase n=1 Tax=Robertkochia solimangrovi TaxID=2213046 RepID=UPI00117DF450|nr:alkaline phosphatase [Robertkochia solimangrovi]TRZ44343.1 alkaline phosphatase [Robertkochia solimangrovi]